MLQLVVFPSALDLIKQRIEHRKNQLGRYEPFPGGKIFLFREVGLFELPCEYGQWRHPLRQHLFRADRKYAVKTVYPVTGSGYEVCPRKQAC